MEERTKERKSHGNLIIYKTLNRILKHKMADTLLTLRNRAYKRDFKETFLRRVFNHSLTYRMRHFFGKWKHSNEKSKLAELVNVNIHKLII